MLICLGCRRAFERGDVVTTVLVKDKLEGVVEHYHERCARALSDMDVHVEKSRTWMYEDVQTQLTK